MLTPKVAHISAALHGGVPGAGGGLASGRSAGWPDGVRRSASNKGFRQQKPGRSRVSSFQGWEDYFLIPISSMEISRILNFWILPVTVIGKASTNL